MGDRDPRDDMAEMLKSCGDFGGEDGAFSVGEDGAFYIHWRLVDHFLGGQWTVK
jgi:hypothetical protein